jgi:16S rRNA (guanine966-N2)-methyltransferase
MRVVAGRYRGRRIEAPPGRSTRPTSDRVREALFSILGDVEGKRVLDLYAGSGALGIEALSRGAATATFVEKDGRTAAVIRANLDTLDAPGEVVRADALRWIATANEAGFDLVLIDPPYDSAPGLGVVLSQRLPALLTHEAVIVSESHKRNPLILDLPLTDERIYGDTRIAFHGCG